MNPDSSDPAIHPVAIAGFDKHAQQYERARPDYAAAAVRWLADRLRLGANRLVLDVGAGTGKFTRQLLSTGAEVIGVEPTAGMRKEFSRVLPNVPVLEGTAESLPFTDGCVDAITAAQAFHWFNTSAAIVEFARVLRPGGGVALVANQRNPAEAVHAFMRNVIEPHRGSAPTFERDRQLWEAEFAATGLFDPLEEVGFPHRQIVDADGLVERVLSTSVMALLPADQQAEIAREVMAESSRFADSDGAIVIPYTTLVMFSRFR